MSRMLTFFVALASAGPAHAAENPGISRAVLEVYLDRTSADPDCRRNIKPDEITVCGRREADRYRVPFIVREAGDPRGEGVWGERERLQHELSPMDLKGPFLVGGGAVGVHFSTSFDGAKTEWRPLAK